LEEKKQFLFFIAFSSEGGWYALAGDECGYDPKCNYLTFRHYNSPDWDNLYCNDEFRTLGPYIKNINECLKQLPALVGPDPSFWSERFWFPNYTLVAIIRHYPNQAKKIVIADYSGEKANDEVSKIYEQLLFHSTNFIQAIEHGGMESNLSLITCDGFVRIPTNQPDNDGDDTITVCI